MTSVMFTARGKMLLSVDIQGHSGYAAEGEDIVCAAVSSAVMLTHALLFDVQRVPVDTLVEDEGAHIRITLPEEQLTRGQDALYALRLHFTELEETYPENIHVTEVEENVED